MDSTSSARLHEAAVSAVQAHIEELQHAITPTGAAATRQRLRKALDAYRKGPDPKEAARNLRIDEVVRSDGLNLKDADAIGRLVGQIFDADKPAVRLRRGADIVPRHVPWLWRKRFAKGEVTLLDGDPGAGKSLIAVTLAAAVTRGTAFPDGQLPDGKGSVVWLGHAGEDSAEYTLMPRFLAAGGDPERLLVLDASTDADLAEVCLHVAVEHPDTTMVAIDSWAAWTDGSDNNSAEAVRKRYRSLQPLQNRGMVVQLIVHDRKAETENLLHKASGTVQVTAAPRMALNVQSGFVTQTKGNLGGKGSTLYFNVEETTIATKGGEIATGRVVWLETPPAGETPPLLGAGVQLDEVIGYLERVAAVDAESAVTCNGVATGIGAQSKDRRTAVKTLLRHGATEGQIVKVPVNRRGQSYDGFHLPDTERPSRPSRPSPGATDVDADGRRARIRRQPSATDVHGDVEQSPPAPALPEVGETPAPWLESCALCESRSPTSRVTSCPACGKQSESGAR